MEKSYTIVIDTLGSDKGPTAILEGCKLVLEKFQNVKLIIVGQEELISTYDLPKDRIRIIEANDTITNLDNIKEALFKKRDASIFKALAECANNDEVIGLICAGNTGALLAGSLRYLLNEKRTRPALAAILPTTVQGKFTCLVDTGASIDCGSEQLIEFAHLGTDFMRKLYKVESPRVALLSNGTEPTKGNALIKETHKLLAHEEGINFVGNVEGSNALNYNCDVLVADGFVGNQLLKITEGSAKNFIMEIMKFGKITGNETVSKQIVGHLMSIYNFESLGAGILLGAKKYCLKCRGSSGPDAILSAAHILLNITENKTFYEN